MRTRITTTGSNLIRPVMEVSTRNFKTRDIREPILVLSESKAKYEVNELALNAIDHRVYKKSKQTMLNTLIRFKDHRKVLLQK